MLNQVLLQGRVNSEGKGIYSYKAGEGEKNSVLRFSLSSQRNFKAKDAEYADWDNITCTAFGMTADLIHKNQGNQIIVQGAIRTGSYEKEDGTKVYTTDVIVDRIYFERGTGAGASTETSNFDSFADAPKADAKPVVDLLG